MNKPYELYLGDCLEIMDRLIEENVKVDCIIVDLPYIQQAASLINK